MPTLMTRLTRLTAFSVMPHRYMRPNMSAVTMATVTVMMRAGPRLKPSSTKDMRNTAMMQSSRFTIVSSGGD